MLSSKSTLTPFKTAALLMGSSMLVLVACGKKEAVVEPEVIEKVAPPVVEVEAETPAPVIDEAPEAAVARTFVKNAETALAALANEESTVYWAYETNINDDTEAAVQMISARSTELSVKLAQEAGQYENVDVPYDVRRKLTILKQGLTLPAPSTEGAAQRLASLTTALSSAYSKGKIEFDGKTVPQNETELLMRNLKDPAKLQEVWAKWREATKAMQPGYAEMVAIVNQGAEGLGYADLGAMWRSGYDMDADAFADETDRLWGQVKPLYSELQCHVKYKLNDKYGDEVVPLDQPIRADLLGNMWAQGWSAIYDDVAPEGSGNPVDLNTALVEKGYDHLQMVRAGEDFFSSLGFDPLPETFWERSQFVKPDDKEVVCHASAWDLDNEDDIRIKMCINVDGDDFITIHHELGHNYYQRAYKNQPHLYKTGANDGFHEAIGDMIALSITPNYLKQIGLIDEVPNADADVGLLMQQALDKVAFLPFGLMVDKWRWQVFSGELAPTATDGKLSYNQGWWKLREEYQGIRPPVTRAGDAFDPGSKYHVPNSVPYMRYFLARILQFQFYKAACDQVGWEGPLHRCSFYGSKEVGTKLNAMLEAGASRPWPETLEMFTGTTSMDGSAVVDYFEPLMVYLQDQNKDRTCGW
ncbi:MAG: M2 family metallopeptidase [Parvularculaceae bacterium]